MRPPADAGSGSGRARRRWRAWERRAGMGGARETLGWVAVLGGKTGGLSGARLSGRMGQVAGSRFVRRWKTSRTALPANAGTSSAPGSVLRVVAALAISLGRLILAVCMPSRRDASVRTDLLATSPNDSSSGSRFDERISAPVPFETFSISYAPRPCFETFCSSYAPTSSLCLSNWRSSSETSGIMFRNGNRRLPAVGCRNRRSFSDEAGDSNCSRKRNSGSTALPLRSNFEECMPGGFPAAFMAKFRRCAFCRLFWGRSVLTNLDPSTVGLARASGDGHGSLNRSSQSATRFRRFTVRGALLGVPLGPGRLPF